VLKLGSSRKCASKPSQSHGRWARTAPATYRCVEWVRRLCVLRSIRALTLALSFQPAYSGAKNVYTEVGSATVTTAWTQVGTWTAQ
jgi:hypothetical protein